MASIIEVVLNGTDNLSGSIGNASASLTSFGGKVAIVAMVMEAVKKLAEFLGECTEEFAEDEKANLVWQSTMKNSVGLTDAETEAMKRFTENIATMTGETISSVESMETFLASSGRTKDQIELVITAATKMSASFGGDVRSNVEKLNATFDGSAGKLPKLVSSIGDLTEAQLKNGDAARIMCEKLGDVDAVMGSSLSVKLANLKNQTDEFKSAIGQLVSPVTNAFVSITTSIIKGWTDAINKSNEYHDNLKKIASDDLLTKAEGAFGLAKAALENVQEAYTIRLKSDHLTSAQDYARAHSELDPKVAGQEYLILLGQVNKMFHDQFSEASIALQIAEANLKAAQATADAAKPASSGGTSTIAPVTTGSNIDGWAVMALNGLATAVGPNGIQAVTKQIIASIEDYDLTGVQGHGEPTTSPLSIDRSQVYAPKSYDDLNKGTGFDPAKFGGFTKFQLALNGIVSTLSSFGGGLLSSVGALSSVQMVLNPMSTILQSMMTVLQPVIDTLLTPIVGILQIIGQTLGAVLAPILMALSPIITLVAQGFVWFYNNAIMPVANFIIGAGNLIYNAVVSVYNWIVSLWGGSQIGLKSIDSGKLTAISMTTLSTTGASAISTASSSGSSASYESQRPINVYITNDLNLYGNPDDSTLNNWYKREQQLIKQGLIKAGV